MDINLIKVIYNVLGLSCTSGELDVIRDMMRAWASNNGIRFKVNDILINKLKGYNDVIYNMVFLYYHIVSVSNKKDIWNKMEKQGFHTDGVYKKLNL